MIGHIKDIVSRFRRENEAVAAVEFALVLPLMIALYFGSIEASALFTADRRINTISATVGDLFAQWDDDDGAIPTATQTNYFAASTALMASSKRWRACAGCLSERWAIPAISSACQ